MHEASNFMTSEKYIRLGKKQVGGEGSVYLIAEAGVNHFGKMDRALRLVDMAVQSGVDAFKIQIYQTEKMISATDPAWRERMKCKELARSDVLLLRDYVIAQGLDFMASAHDEESLDWLPELGVPAIKIGSGEMRNVAYLKRAAQKGLPLIFSTGMQTIEDVQVAMDAMEDCSAGVALLHCVTLYPTQPEEVNLRAMDSLRKCFRVPVGYSDHTIGISAVLAAVARGACIIEKHIALERGIPNTQDPIVSCVGFEELSEMVRQVREVEQMLGKDEKKPADRESVSIGWARKSAVAARDLSAGTIITADMVAFKRPGNGMAPDRIEEIIGKRLNTSILADEQIREYFLEGNQ